ncbi:MAG TPA: hypothetical protein VJ779_20390 [Acetobacteraceae bacterium]|nr:hypothetical protein [Acetobacteraceae bacterium]
MDHAKAATLLALLLTAPASLTHGQAEAELCATIEASPDRQHCQVKLFNSAAAGELPNVIAGACPAGTHLTVELPSSGLYHLLVSSLCQSPPVQTGPKMFTCLMRGTSQGRGGNRQNSGALLEHHPMLDRHAAHSA